MALTIFNQICQNDSWSIVDIYHSESPVFPKCLIDTAIYVLPLSVFITINLLIQGFSLLFKRRRWTAKGDNRWNLTSASQIFSFFMLSLVTMTYLVFIPNMHSQGDFIIMQFVTVLLKLTCILFIINTLIYNRRTNIHTSACAWFLAFWLTFANVTHCLLQIAQATSLNRWQSNLLYIETVFSITALIVTSFSTYRPPMSDDSLDEIATYGTFYQLSEEDSPPNPELHASFLSMMLFYWPRRLIIDSNLKPSMSVDDLFSLHPMHSSDYIGERFLKIWQWNSDERQSNYTGKKKNVFLSLTKCYGAYYTIGAIAMLTFDCLRLIQPFLLKWLLSFISNREETPHWHGYLIIFTIVTITFCDTVTQSFAYDRMMRTGTSIRTVLGVIIYRKALRVSLATRNNSTTGEIVNLMSVDADRFKNFFVDSSVIWSGILRIVLSTYFIYNELGYAVFAGLGVMLIIIPITSRLSKVMESMQTSQMKKKDERIKLMNDILSGIKVIKFYAWEASFSQLINDIRNLEIQKLKILAYIQATFTFLFTSAPLMVSLVTFATFALSDSNNILTAEKAFVSLAFFNILKIPIFAIPRVLTMLVMAGVANKRLNKFLNSPEMVKYITHQDDDECIIRVTDATFGYGRTITDTLIDQTVDEQIIENDETGHQFELKDITLNIKPGSLVAIVGPVASGKSSLLYSLLGEMDKQGGSVNIVPGKTIGYVAQQAWIQNDTLKNNITFGSNLDESKYNKIIAACQLLPDISMLPAGDETEIGEKGINLSGGQKQRLSLARACYSDADIYFLDDPLSAVDSHVSTQLFSQVISSQSGILRKKTRLLVTNDLSILPRVDQVYVIRAGKIVESGEYDQLMNNNGYFANFVREFVSKHSNNDGKDIDVEENDDMTSGGTRSRSTTVTTSTAKLESMASTKTQATSDDASKLTENEKMEQGRVKLSVYLTYLKNYPLLILAVVFVVLMQVTEASTNYWLSLWADDAESPNGGQSPTVRIAVYGALGAASALSSYVGAALIFRGGIVCARLLHRLLLDGVLRNSMEFFDTTPIGRILNRFSKDIDTIDIILPDTVSFWLIHCTRVLGTLTLISIIVPIFLIVVAPVLVVYYFIVRMFIPCARQLRRLLSVSLSPVYSHFSETLSGLTTIRAYRANNRFIKLSDDKFNISQKAAFCSAAADRWMALRLLLIGNTIFTTTAIFAILSKDRLTPALAGLAVTYSMSITGTLEWLVKLTSRMEADIVSVERVLEYANNDNDNEWGTSLRPSTSWPAHGKIQFDEYTAVYRENLAPALKNINVTIDAGERVGIVGRTGAGKSSLTLALFRLIEPIHGTIYIDDLDISKIGLHDLRRVLTIIPQDPVLFSGKLRVNLDPFNHHTDDQLWYALELAHLKEYVISLEGQLDHSIAEGGTNLSVGQRQLICLARALLKKTKILILDEATAAVDLQTDSLIQSTVRREFTDCTILTIAHRLNTIIDSDRVLVLDNGQVVEFDPPNDLLADKSSLFYSLALDAGIV